MKLIQLVIFMFVVFSLLPRAYALGKNDVRAAYLGAHNINSKVATNHIKWLLLNTEINAVVIDCKEDRLLPDSRSVLRALREFKSLGAYTICRFVVAQDNKFVADNPGSAVRLGKGGALWYSRRWEIKDRNGVIKMAELHWADMAAPQAYRYNLEQAKKVVALGFDEINLDYIRFPTDGPKEKYFPFWDNMNPKPSKTEVIEGFLERITRELRTEKKPDGRTIVISVDPFGYAFFGEEAGIGQRLLGIVKYADVVMPMTYPSHYWCGEFDFKDPTLFPQEVVYATLTKGLRILRNARVETTVRPWIQDFSIQNIYGCYDEKRAGLYVWKTDLKTGKRYFIVPYHEREVRLQIDVARELGLKGYALWNASNDYTKGALVPKK